MSYELSLKHESDYLYAQATGISTIENITAMSKEYFAVCDEHGYKKVLLDVRGMTGGSDIGTLGAYNLIKKDIRALAIPSPLKVAAIDSEENRKDSRFVEDMAVNEGLNLRIFTDVDRAMAWLGVGVKAPLVNDQGLS